MAGIVWYSIDRELNTVDHEPVSLAEALEIAQRYYGNADKEHEQAEDAIAETMFGFERESDGAFIELCVNGRSRVSCKLEIPRPAKSWLSRVFGGPTQVERNLESWSEVAARIEEFFSLEPAVMASRLRAEA